MHTTTTARSAPDGGDHVAVGERARRPERWRCTPKNTSLAARPRWRTGERPHDDRYANEMRCRRASAARRSFERHPDARRWPSLHMASNGQPFGELRRGERCRRWRDRLLRRRHVELRVTSRDVVLRLERVHVEAVGGDVERQLEILDLGRRGEADRATWIAHRRGSAPHPRGIRAVDRQGTRGARRRHDQPHDREGRDG